MSDITPESMPPADMVPAGAVAELPRGRRGFFSGVRRKVSGLFGRSPRDVAEEPISELQKLGPVYADRELGDPLISDEARDRFKGGVLHVNQADAPLPEATIVQATAEVPPASVEATVLPVAEPLAADIASEAPKALEPLVTGAVTDGAKLAGTSRVSRWFEALFPVRTSGVVKPEVLAHDAAAAKANAQRALEEKYRIEAKARQVASEQRAAKRAAAHDLRLADPANLMFVDPEYRNAQQEMMAIEAPHLPFKVPAMPTALEPLTVTTKAPTKGFLARVRDGVSRRFAALSLAGTSVPKESLPLVDVMGGHPLAPKALSAPAPLVLAITPEKGPPLPFDLTAPVAPVVETPPVAPPVVHTPSGGGSTPRYVQVELEAAKAESHLGKWGAVTGLALATVGVGYAAYRHHQAKREKADHWVQQVSDSPAEAHLR